jgi:hypothetical protein
MFDGKTIGRGTNVAVNVAYDVQDVQGIDSLEILEHVITGYNVSGSISRVGIRGQTVKSLGFFPNVGKDSDEHLANVIAAKEGVLVLMDKASPPKNLMTITRVTFAGHGWQLAAGGLVGVDIEWRAIRAS